MPQLIREHSDILQGPIRVPTVVPGRWLYLRSWTDWGTHAERTWASAWMQVVAQSMSKGAQGGYIRFQSPFDMIDSGVFPQEPGTYADAAARVDAHLKALGAELVPNGEWPHDCQGAGGWPADRQPFGHDLDRDMGLLFQARGREIPEALARRIAEKGR